MQVDNNVTDFIKPHSDQGDHRKTGQGKSTANRRAYRHDRPQEFTCQRSGRLNFDMELRINWID